MRSLLAITSLVGVAFTVAPLTACGSSTGGPERDGGHSTEASAEAGNADSESCTTDASEISCCCEGDVQQEPTCSAGTLTCATGYGLYHGADCSCSTGRGPCCIGQDTLDASGEVSRNED